ncbi:hypothetical protein [Hyphomonas oceanitis]|uniref:Uncharacterized protein n=1 Tax=Hyphomonas oceanitis SCH89 TaxID=1280953 RepID=A0A059G5T8_9PROT|nr:hypothetical protein [Hyphomonas oceanitis]KDA01823.1 hypothetical protein HOC_13664 [Hyphomonas oceanitis SCH89]
MTRLPCILMLSLCLVPQSLALEPDTGTPDRTSRESDLSSNLELFVQGAIREGILTPKGPASVESHGEDEGSDHQPAQLVKKRPPGASVPDRVYDACDAGDAFDFTDYKDVTEYQQVYTARETAGRHVENATPASSGYELAKTYMVLGLYSEAQMVLKLTPGAEATALGKLADLMENRGAPDVGFFAQMVSCKSDTAIWLAAAELVSGREAGAERLQGALSEFRKLPLRLRSDVTLLSIPKLEERGKSGLAQKLIADFDENDFQDSPQLQFARALIQMDGGNTEAQKTVSGFLRKPRFQEAALAAMQRHGIPVEPAYEEVLLGDLMQKFGYISSDKELVASLQYALRELSARSSYKPLMKLAAQPALQNPEAQTEVRRQLVASLHRDLESSESVRNLAAIDAMIEEPDFLANEPDRNALYSLASGRAVQLGFADLASKLSNGVSMTEGVAAETAELAFRRREYETVFALATKYIGDPSLNLLAARSAIRAHAPERLRVYEDRLEIAPDVILALIEDDATTGDWIVSEWVYTAARMLTGDDHKRRVALVAELRRAARKGAVTQTKVSVAQAPAIFNRASGSAVPVGGGN